MNYGVIFPFAVAWCKRCITVRFQQVAVYRFVVARNFHFVFIHWWGILVRENNSSVRQDGALQYEKPSKGVRGCSQQQE